jgi:hypothetical protein
MKTGCLLLALVALALLSPALDWAIRAVGQGAADAARILALGAAVALVLLAGGAVWALKPQAPRPVRLYELHYHAAPEPLSLPVAAVDVDWVEVDG